MSNTASATAESIKQYTLGEEIANATTHGLGVLLGVVGLPILLIFAVQSGVEVGYKIAASIVYCATMIILYLASTLYHALTDERAKRLFKILDHASIYLLIAGTYTPFALITLRESGGWMLMGLLWGMAALGIASEVLWKSRPRWVAALIYLVMGWSAVGMVPTMYRLLDPWGFWLIVGGALAYSLGTIFYVLKRFKWFHSVFHGWVLLASFLFFFAILLFVIV